MIKKICQQLISRVFLTTKNTRQQKTILKTRFLNCNNKRKKVVTSAVYTLYSTLKFQWWFRIMRVSIDMLSTSYDFVHVSSLLDPEWQWKTLGDAEVLIILTMTTSSGSVLDVKYISLSHGRRIPNNCLPYYDRYSLEHNVHSSLMHLTATALRFNRVLSHFPTHRLPMWRHRALIAL